MMEGFEIILSNKENEGLEVGDPQLTALKVDVECVWANKNSPKLPS
jgi:hypothetical protein